MRNYIVIDQFGKLHRVIAEIYVYVTVDTNRETLTFYNKEEIIGYFINPNAFYRL